MGVETLKGHRGGLSYGVKRSSVGIALHPQPSTVVRIHFLGFRAIVGPGGAGE